jgi:4-amino-4-deoxy-L-arabinose transferase-like glycosyltransferase
MKTRSSIAGPLLLLALFLAALLPRLWAVGWGLPYVEHSDEPAVMEVAMRMVQQGDWNPGMFLYPSLFFYLLAGVIKLHTAWGLAAGLYASPADLPAETYLFTTAPALYLWARALVAILGAACVPLLYVLGRRMFDRPAALLAAALLIVAAYPVEHAHYVTTDVPTGLWVTIALLGAWSVARDGGWRGYLVGALGTGLAAGTKYNAGVVGLALAVAALIYALDARRAGRPGGPVAAAQAGRLAAAGALSLLVFLATTPFALLDLEAFRRGMQINAVHYASGSHGNFVGRWRLDGYLAFFWRDGLLPAGSLILLAGLPLLARRHPRQLAVLGAAVVACVGLLLTQAVNFNRNTLPVFPPLLLLAAAAAMELARWLGAQAARLAGVDGPQVVDIRPGGPSTAATHRAAVARRVALPAAVALAALLIVPQLLETTWLLRYWSRPHTLVEAAAVLRAQPRGMLAAVEANPVQWAGDPAVTPVRRLGERPAEWYAARGYRYLLLNAERYGDELRGEYDRLRAAGAPLLAMPERYLGLQPGPGGALVDLGERLDLMPFARRQARFGDSVELLGFELRPGELRPRITPLEGADERALAPGEPVQINLYWRALAPMAADYSLFIHVYDGAGARVAQRDLPLRYGDYPTSRWRPGELVIDRGDMALPALPPGAYRLEIGLYDAATGAALPVEGGAPVVLTTITVQ